MNKYIVAGLSIAAAFAAEAVVTTLEYEDRRAAEDRAAISNEISRAVSAAAPGNYANVSNAAMNAVQPTNMPTLANYPMKQWGENIYIAGDEYIDVSTSYHGNIMHRIFDGWYLSLSTAFWDQFSDVALSGSYNDLTDKPEIPSAADFSTNNMELVATIEATAPAPGDYAAVSNAAMNALAKADFVSATNELARSIPTNVSELNNDAGYLTSYTETDPTVHDWAKAATKPTYTASEVGAATPGIVTNIVRDLSLGGIWDGELEVWWTPRMSNGSLVYEATTNINLNAEN